MGLRLRLLVPFALGAVVAASSAAVAVPGRVLPATYQDWKHPGEGWTEHSELLRSDDDGVPDLAVAGGERQFGYIWTAGGNPASLLRGLRVATGAGQDAASVRVLSGRTGEVVWQQTWPATGPDGVRSMHFVEGLATGALDAVPGDDVLVLRRTLTPAPDGQSWTWTEYTTLHDGASGAVRWETSSLRTDQDLFTMRSLVPVVTGGRTVAVLQRYAFRAPGDRTPHRTEVRTSIVKVGQRGLTQLAALPTVPGVFGFVDAAPTADGVLVFSSLFSNTRLEELDDDGMLTATHVRLDGVPSLQRLWARPGLASGSTTVTGGERPALIVTRADGTRALELRTGRQRWRHETAGQTFDPYREVGEGDVNGDGVSDVIVSPETGDAAYRDDFTTELLAVDGRTGNVLWSRLEPTGKFGARAYTVLDVDGDGRQELAAATLQHDGYPFVGQYDDDPAQVVIYDLGDGDPRCRFPLDRLPSRLDAVSIHSNDHTGEQLLAVGLSGVVSVQGYRLGFCDPLS